MSTKYLGQPFDIHGGGVENKFPHHECEIAQAEAANDKPFARYWLHNGMLMIRGEEMHKSLGNFVTLEQAFEHWDPMAIRFFVLLAHYRNPLDLTAEAMDAASKGLERLFSTIRAVRRRLRATPPLGEAAATGIPQNLGSLLKEGRSHFEESMNNDFNTPGALAALFDITREVNSLLNADQPLSRGALESIDTLYAQLAGDVLGLTPQDSRGEPGAGLVPGLIELLVDTRLKLRQNKQWALADEIRARLSGMGVQLQDGPKGTTWSTS